MRKRVKMTLALAAVVVVGRIAWGAFGEREPRYGGKPISYWIRRAGREYEGSGFPGLPSLVNDSNAVPYLIEALRYHDRPLHERYSRAYWGSPYRFQRCLPTPVSSSLIHEAVAFHFGYMGELAKPAIPALLQALAQDESPLVRVLAARSLLAICKDDHVLMATVLRTVIKRDCGILEDSDAATFLHPMADGLMESALHAIAQCLADPDSRVRKGATNVLLLIDPIAAAKAGVNTNAPAR